jgi:uncharacterized protein with GYD domain
MNKLVALATVMLVTMSSAIAAEDSDDVRYFMFVGEPNAAAWKFLMENPADREKEVAAGMEAVGGKVLSYYFGLGDGKNYITVQLPDDNEVIQAVYMMRLPAGLLNSYQVIELMPSDQMSEALKRSKQFLQMEKDLGGGVNDSR